uniref:NAC domain-containing protein 77-like n=1 Tax=Fragaria vesca subsp. vesca TaxID=101020 RepID=UPI0005C97B50|nr:PREDICTED: NAC domain-containing protein 77-like [Fragaria vesca subsp. vesca]
MVLSYALAFEGESRLYFFTPLQKKHTKGTRKKRDTVHGLWKGTQTPKTIKDSDNKPVITKTPFCYYHPRGKNVKKTQWLMDEYRLINHDNHHIMLENWALCVVHYKKRGGNGNNNEKEDNKSRSTNKSSSTGSRSEAMGSTFQTSLIGSASECASTMSSQNGNSCQTPTPSKNNTIPFGYSNSSMGSSSSQPRPNWSYNVNPKKQQQSSTSDQPLLTRGTYNIASHDDHDSSGHALFPKRTPSGIGSPNCDQTPNCSNTNDLSLNNNVSGDQMLSDFDFMNDSTFSDLYTMLHDESLQSSLPQQRDDDTQNINPSINPPVHFLLVNVPDEMYQSSK